MGASDPDFLREAMKREPAEYVRAVGVGTEDDKDADASTDLVDNDVAWYIQEYLRRSG